MTMQGTKVKPTYCYYRLPDKQKTIKLAVATDLEQLKYIRHGWQPLLQYGKFEATSPYVMEAPLEGLRL